LTPLLKMSPLVNSSLTRPRYIPKDRFHQVRPCLKGVQHLKNAAGLFIQLLLPYNKMAQLEVNSFPACFGA
jgi:hypothetical protein